MHHSEKEYGLESERDRMQLFAEAKELGFHGVELGIGLDYKEDPLWTGCGDFHKAIKEKAQITGTKAASICLHLLNYKEHSPASDRMGHREAGREIISKSIEACACIGASVILVPFFGTAALRSEEQIQFLIREMRVLSKVAEDGGVYLSLETSLKAPDLIRIVDSVGSDYVQVYFDVGNTASMGYNMVQEIETLGERIVQVHVKDYPGGSLGGGEVDFDEVIGALKKVGFDGYLMLETPSLDDSIKAASSNLAYIMRIVEGH
jgi:hexulose-6-phosphate isomerase